MKHNISDLLDGYEEKDIDLRADGALHLRRIKELTMKNAKGARTGRRFAPARVLLIAAIVAAITCSALAVGYTLKAGDWFKDFFGTAEEPISTEQREVLNDIGATFDGSVTSNGTTVTPLAAIADENMYYLRLRIEAPKGTMLPEYSKEDGPFYQLSGNRGEEYIQVLYPEEPERNANWSMHFDWLPDNDATDNVKEVVVVIYAQADTGTCFTDGAKRVLNFKGLWLQSPDKVYTQILSGDFEIDMGQYESQLLDLDCEGLSWYSEKTSCTSTLHALSISPLSLGFTYSWSGVNDTRYIQPVGPMEVVMKDGSSIRAGGFQGGGMGEKIVSYTPFSTPLDLSQVDYILYADHRIYLPE